MSLASVLRRIGQKWPLFAAVLLMLGATPVKAEKTLMFMVDFFLQQSTDTIINLNVYQPPNEISYKGGTPPSPVLTNAYETEKFGWWYALPKFNADDYGMGRIRINTLYTRGWYQNDDHFITTHDTSRLLAAGQTSFQYRIQGTTRDTIVLPDSNGFVTYPTSHDTTRPKLYTSAGNSGTDVLNMRGTTPATMTGGIDKCVDAVPSDTVWIRWGTPTAPPGQQPTAASMQCTSYNPFSVRFAQVFIRNPWPGADQPVVEFNGQDVAMFPSSNPDWLVADLRYLPTQSVPSGVIRFKKGVGSSNYFDSAGVDVPLVKPFVIKSDGGSNYFVPSEAGGGLVQKTGAFPVPLYTLFVQNPWKPGNPRLMWEEDQNLHVMRPTQNCGWFKYPLYAAPKRVLIGHSYEDSTYGSTGVQFRGRTNWIDIPASAFKGTEVYIQTRDASDNRIPALATANPLLKNCSTDSIKLVMEVFDFKGRGVAGGNPAFQVGGLDGAGSCGLAKGLVKSTLSQPEGLPIWSGKDTGTIGKRCGLNDAVNTKKSNPGNWFDTVATKAQGIDVGHGCIELPLTKKPADSGYYQFRNEAFFPIDNPAVMGGDTRGVSPYASSPIAPNDGANHNFLFCMHGHAAFEYTPGLKFEFKGDDDVWVFINNTLAVDLGGQHSPESASVNLDRLKLREGSVYPFDIFYCERQTNQSHIQIRTTMDLQPSWKYRATKTGTGSAIKVVVEGQESQNYAPSCADLTKQTLVWKPTSGRMVVVGPDGSNLKNVYFADTSLYGGNLSYTAINGTIQLDTNRLKSESGLMWPGVYTVRVESRLGDSLWSVSFTKTYGSVVINGTVLDVNGDGVADSIHLVAPRAIFADAPSAYRLAWYYATGKKDSVSLTHAQVDSISPTEVMASLAGKPWGELTKIPAGVRVDSMGAVLTHPDGLVTAISNPIKLIDGMAAVADSAYLKYSDSDTGEDSLFVWASEPVTKMSTVPAALAAWTLLGKPNAPRLTPGEAALLGDGSRFVFTFKPSANPVASGDSLRLGAWAADAARNQPTALSKWVAITSNQVAKGWMLDNNGDGAPDSVGLWSKGDLSLVDSVRVQWKTAKGIDTVVSVKTVGGIAAGVKLPANILGGATYCVGCRIEAFQAGTSRKFTLADSVDPIAVAANYHFGASEDTLYVTVSESVVKGAAAGEGWVAQKIAGTVGGLGTVVLGVADSSVAGVLKLRVVPGVVLGDSLRLRGWSQDRNGNVPGAVSPWVAIVYGPQPIRVVVFDRDQDGQADSVIYRLTRSAAGAPVAQSFGLVWGGISHTTTGLVRSADLRSWSGAIGPFPLGTSALTSDSGWIALANGDVTSFRARAEDSVAPVAIDSAIYHYGPAAGPDTLFVTASEKLKASGVPWVKSKAGEAYGNATDVASNNKLQILITPSSWTGADSVRLGAGVADGLGNAPGATSRLVKVVYGTQPIRVVVWDRNGDGVIDSVAYRLTRSGAGIATPTGFGLKWAGQVAVVGSLVRSADNKSWAGPVTSALAFATARATDDAGWFVMGSDITSYRAMVEDSVAPVARSAKLIFGFDAGASDTIEVIGSEELAVANSGAWLQLGKDSASASPTLLTSAQAQNANPVMASAPTRIRLVVPSGSIANDAAWVRFGAAVSDKSVAVGASSLWVPLVITPSGRAYLFDSDGDGRADSLRVAIHGTMKNTSSVRLTWSDASGAAVSKDWPVVPGAGSFGVRPSSDKWFEKGATSCPGTCTATFRDADGNILTWNLVDSVAPMLLKASYSFGGSRDTLRATFSEPLKAIDPLSPWLEYGPVGLGAVKHAEAALAVAGNQAVFLIDTANGARENWDSLRLAAGLRSGAVSDAGGIKTGVTSPWAPVEYGLPAMTAKLLDPNGQGRGTDVEVRLVREVPAAALTSITGFEFSWTNAAGTGLEQRTVAIGSLTAAAGIWTGVLAQPFALGRTGCLSGGCAASAVKTGSQRPMVLADGVPTSLIWARYRYSLPAVALDTVVVGLSEPWAGGAVGDPAVAFALLGTSRGIKDLSPWTSWQLSADKLQLTMVVDTTWEQVLGEGDSARLAQGSRVVDAVGNLVGVASRWVKIAFGMRPPELSLKPWPNGVLTNVKADGHTPWDEPALGTPAIELLVRNPGDSLAKDPLKGWHRVEGIEVGNPASGGASKNPENHLLGVKFRLNRPLEGTLIIYDNMGTSVRQIDLKPLAKLWTEDPTQKDAMRDVWVAWNGTGPDGKFAASGVYLFRAVAKVDDGEGHLVFRNLVWKLGWRRDVR